MKRKLIPPFLMLSMGAISSIIMLVLHYEINTMLFVLLGVLIAFYIIGCLLKWMLDTFDRQNEALKASEENEGESGEGEVGEEGPASS